MQQRLGRYRILGSIARGGGGEVFRAVDPSRGREVALKVLRGRGQRKVQRLTREAESLLRLEHPHVVEVLDVGQHEGALFLAMELLEESLEDRLQRQGPLEPRAAAQLARKLALALAHAHRCGLLHRDLKPSNVLFTRDGEPKLADFGLARDVDEGSARLTRSGAYLGTPGYWSPEQAQGRRGGQGPHTDVYGLGATLYAALTGEPPFEPTSIPEAVAFSLQAAPRPSQVNRAVDGRLDAVVARCLAPEPSERYRDGDALARALGDYLEGRGPRAYPRGLLIAVLAVVVALAAGLGVALWPVASRAEPSVTQDPLADARAALVAGRFEAALEHLTGLESPEAEQARGEALVWLDRFDEAEVVFRALAGADDPARATLGLAVAQLGQSKCASGWRDLLTVPSSLDDDVLFAYGSALAGYRHGDNEGGLQWCEPVLRRYPRHEGARVLELWLLTSNAQEWNALDRCEAWVAEDPNSPRARAELVNLYGNLGREDDFRAALAAAHRDFPDDLQIGLSFAAHEQREGRPGAAEALLADLMRAHPGSPTPHMKLADLLLERGEVDLAMREVDAAVALEPENPRALWRKATCLMAAKQLSLAVKASLDAVEDEFALSQPVVELGARLRQLGRDDLAERVFAGVLGRVPARQGAALCELGMTFLSVRESAWAEAAYRRAEPLLPAPALHGLVLSQADQGKLEDAQQAVMRLESLTVTPTVHVLAAHSLSRLGRLDEVQAHLDRLDEEAISFTHRSLQLRLLLELRRYAEAEAAAQRCLDAYPNVASAHLMWANVTVEAVGVLYEQARPEEGRIRVERVRRVLRDALRRGMTPSGRQHAEGMLRYLDGR